MNTYRLSQDPFSAPIIPKFREIDISIVRDAAPKHQVSDDSTQDFVRTLQAIYKHSPPKPIYIPKTAEFFDFKVVSDFELQYEFAHFPIYQEIRNFMVAMYRIFSKHYLPYTLCRRNIKAPAHVTLEIYQFLTKVGLINNPNQEDFDKKTIPTPIVPNNTVWPTLINNFSTEEILSTDQFNKRFHPPPPDIPLVLPQYHMMSTAFNSSDKNWPKVDQQKFVASCKDTESWADLAQKTGKTEKQVVEYVLDQPLAIPRIETQAQLSFDNFKPPVEMMKEVALSNNIALRKVKRALDAAGEKRTKQIFMDEIVDPIEENDAVQAAGILAMQKIVSNAKTMRQLHKKRVLDCLTKTVEILTQDINMKKAMIQEALSEKAEQRRVESDFESVDE